MIDQLRVSKPRPQFKALLAILALVAATPLDSLGAEKVQPAPDYIVSPRLETRILLPLGQMESASWFGLADRPALTPPLLGLQSAVLTLEFEESVSLVDLEVEVFPVVTPWDSKTVTWELAHIEEGENFALVEEPWQVEGGDIYFTEKRESKPRHEAVIETIRAGKLREKISFDLRWLLEAAAEEGFPVYGFAVSVPWEVGEGFRPEELETFGTILSARLDIAFSQSVPAGVSGGAWPQTEDWYGTSGSDSDEAGVRTEGSGKVKVVRNPDPVKNPPPIKIPPPPEDPEDYDPIPQVRKSVEVEERRPVQPVRPNPAPPPAVRPDPKPAPADPKPAPAPTPAPAKPAPVKPAPVDDAKTSPETKRAPD